MKVGLWVWPAEQKEQRRILKRVAESEHLMAAMQAIAKSKEGLSNSELDDVLADNSNWMTRWVVEQLTSLGFVDYKVQLFGGPGKYDLTELGMNALSAITGQPVKPRQPPAQPQPTPVQAKPSTPAPQPEQTAAQH
ncbi:MAG: hypothetical protein LYZ69_07750 [Nitrososphaerales archaeon]|nr:hypothetical protein [Nitrososphaerales archaeon]